MESTRKIIRRSIFTLLKDFHYFTTNPPILLLPFSVSVLLYQSCSKPKSLFVPFSRFSFLDLNLYEELIFNYVFSLPFALSSLIIAKASIIQFLDHHYNKPPISSLYKPLVLTYLCNTIFTIIIKVATFFLLLFVSNFIQETFGLSSKNPVFLMGARVFFYLILTHTLIVCNLALVMAGMDDSCIGHKAIHKACLLRKDTNSMALLLALPINLGLASIESLFQYRIVRAYHFLGRPSFSMVVEGCLIANMYSICIVLDTIAYFLFIKSYESSHFGLTEENCRATRSRV